ncbi:MAG: serine/threonine protein kinase [Planctomycetaceae bacterium]|nr:serine/threonine protein kinase [Planctomycetaceae bacterium]
MNDQILLKETDRDLPRHVKNGYMRYREFKPLTQGGEAILQTCLDENLGRTVVMKTLQPQFQNLDTYKKRFLREARVTALIPHPATVPVYELSRDAEGNAYFTMKRLNGRDLCDILDQIAVGDEATRERYPRSDLIAVLIRACECLSYAHAHGVVHRDLKPANIMIGDYGEVTVLDWGLAKVWDMEEDDELDQMLRSGQQKMSGRLTGRGDVQGTPFYMSPEQAIETGDVDERTDIYNMGIILFEVLTGESYMSGRNFKEIKRKLLEDPVREPRRIAPKRGIPPELNAICTKALNKDRTLRYQKMEELLKDLRSLLRGQEVMAYEAPLLVRIWKWRHEKVFNVTSMFWLTVGISSCLVIQALIRLLLGH